MVKIIFANLFYYLVYFYYYLWILLYFLVLFINFTVLFQLTFTFVYSIFNKKISISTKWTNLKQTFNVINKYLSTIKIVVFPTIVVGDSLITEWRGNKFVSVWLTCNYCLLPTIDGGRSNHHTERERIHLCITNLQLLLTSDFRITFSFL